MIVSISLNLAVGFIRREMGFNTILDDYADIYN